MMTRFGAQLGQSFAQFGRRLSCEDVLDRNTVTMQQFNRNIDLPA